MYGLKYCVYGIGKINILGLKGDCPGGAHPQYNKK